MKEEDWLAEKAETADELLQLLTKHSPSSTCELGTWICHLKEITVLMQEIEAEISEGMEVR